MAVFWVYQTTRRFNPEDSHLRTHRRENVKSYIRYFDCDLQARSQHGLKTASSFAVSVCLSVRVDFTLENNTGFGFSWQLIIGKSHKL
jgi:hypothetical protein